MKTAEKEKGQGVVEYAIILFFVCVVVIALLMISYGPRARFDMAIDSGEIVLVGNEIRLGGVGHPLHSDIESSEVVGFWLEELSLDDNNHPRKFFVTGCVNLFLPGQKSVVFAATPVTAEVAELIDVQVPLQPGGYIQVCVPDELREVPVFLWTK